MALIFAPRDMRARPPGANVAPPGKEPHTMRRLFELESEGEFVNDPLDSMEDLSNQPINDPDD